MAEAEEPKTLTLAQQWVLQENAQHQEERGETPAEARQTTEEETPANADVEEPVTDKTVEESSAVEEPVIEKFNEEASAAEETVAENSDESSASEGSTDVAGNKESEEQEAAEEKPSVKIETAPVDFRFPTTNQTRHCFTRYVEYHRCVAVKGEDAPECDKFAKYYRSLCPGEWEEGWGRRRLLGVIHLTPQSSERRLQCIYSFLRLTGGMNKGRMEPFLALYRVSDPTKDRRCNYYFLLTEILGCFS